MNILNSDKNFFQLNILKNALLKNKKLVRILNHKMFKGFQKIKTLINPNFNIDLFIEKVSDDYNSWMKINREGNINDEILNSKEKKIKLHIQ